jgi:mono/diheme cytochrome c family protein
MRAQPGLIEARYRVTSVILPGLVFLCLASASAHGAPHVVGYERFHADGATAAGGAILFSELGCANCHAGSAVVVPRKGPNLVDLAKRVDHDWLAEFLRNPEAGRKGSNMPRMVHGLADPDIDAIMSYLGTLGKNANLKVPKHANAERGSALYHEKGCVACHAPTPDFHPPHGPDDLKVSPLAIAHPDFGRKTSFAALMAFLDSPSTWRPDGRMPHVALEGQESADLAAHLLDFQDSDPGNAKKLEAWPKANPGAVAKGRELFAKLNCAACHTIPGAKAAEPLPLAPGTATAKDCLASEPVPGRPHYALTGAQRDSLLAFLGGQRATEDPDGRLTLAAMNCYACHDRDGIGGPTPETNPFFVGDEALGDSGRLAPPLTGIGHKLRTTWLEGVFTGAEGSRVRSYVKTRMPNYPAHAKSLSDWLARIDARPDAKPIVEHPGDLEAGRKLLGIVGGTNCITCHTWGGQRSLGIQALDLSSLDRRLRPEWFRSYLLNPAEYRPGTLMPPLWPGGQATVRDVLGGDTERQIAAIWSFIKEGEGLPEGFPDRSSGLYELIPTDRPILQRTFFEGTGTKAILVGFPGGINLAYDGSGARPAVVWRGAFFDAYQTWYSRHAPFEKPLGEDVAALGETGAETGRRFRGYRLDSSGNPVFLYSEGNREVSEAFAVADGTLMRTLSWTEGSAPAVAHPEGVAVDATAEVQSLTFIYSWK